MERSGLAPNDDGSGRTTVEMQDPNTFLDAGWDLVGETRNGTSEIWMMPAGGGYPVPSIFHGYRPPSLNGRGTTADPYLIASAAELGVVAWHNRTACFRLAANIDLAGIQWSTAVIPVFSGVFDANDLVIANLTIVGGDYLGLFGTLEPGGQVRNMGIVDVNVISSGKYAGGLAGRNHGTASDCYTTGTVAARSYAGGLVGCNEGLVTECYSTSSVAGGFAGGLVGCQSGRVIKSHSTGAVAGRVNVGGLVGVNYPDSVIEDCYSTGKVEGEVYIGGLLGCGSLDYVTRSYSTGAVAGLSKVGGLVGLCGGLIENCYSRSIVSGESCVGGLVGDSTFGSIVRCYSTGPVSGTVSCGGLLGYDYFSSPSVVDSFWDIETSGCATSEGGTGLTMGQMRQRASFAAWDFEHVWTICEDRDYPRLQWEGVDCYE